MGEPRHRVPGRYAGYVGMITRTWNSTHCDKGEFYQAVARVREVSKVPSGSSFVRAIEIRSVCQPPFSGNTGIIQQKGQLCTLAMTGKRRQSHVSCSLV